VTTAHEPRRGPGVHPSTEDLSALAEGAEPAAEGVAAHLEDCAACRAEVDAISELLTAFAEWDAPALPQEVAIRIDAALVRESMARAAEVDLASDAADAKDAVQRPQSSPRGRRPARWRGLGWGLASLALLAGGLTLAVDLTSSSAGSSTASGASALSSSRDSSGPMAQRQLAAPGTMIATAPLVVWVKEILPTRTSGKAGPNTAVENGSPCLSDPKFIGYKRLASTDGTYDGTGATLVVYANGGDSSSVYAVAYAKPCTASSFPVLAEGVVSY
jgi:hypothetical protein